MTNEQRQEIVRRLNERGATAPCSRCGHRQFEIIDYSKFWAIEDGDFGVTNLSAPVVPAVMIACTHCGAISFHALGPLGLLNNPQQGNNHEGN